MPLKNQYQVALPIFEGPMDLLLHLIRENKLDIYDIPIADITQKYLDTLELMKEFDLEVAGDFLVLAATLIHIKSRMLLPPDEPAKGEEPEDPRTELVERLLEFEKFKETTKDFRRLEDVWRLVFSRPPVEDDREIIVQEPSQPMLFDFNLFDLLSAFKKMLENTPAGMGEITREVLTVKDKINTIIERLEGLDNMRFDDLFIGTRTRRELVVTFLALLEILRLGLVRVYQERHMASIWLIATRPEI